MKTSLGITLLTAAVLALLLMPSAAFGEGKNLPADSGPRVCDGAPEELLFTPMDLLAADKPAGPTPKIYNGPCSWCNSNSSCTSPCIDDNGNQSDCGDYGVCNWCGTALVELNRVTIGVSIKRYLGGAYCKKVNHEEVTYQSMNAGCQPFTVCVKRLTGWYAHIGGPSCCEWFGCGGTLCPY